MLNFVSIAVYLEQNVASVPRSRSNAWDFTDSKSIQKKSFKRIGEAVAGSTRTKRWRQLHLTESHSFHLKYQYFNLRTALARQGSATPRYLFCPTPRGGGRCSLRRLDTMNHLTCRSRRLLSNSRSKLHKSPPVITDLPFLCPPISSLRRWNRRSRTSKKILESHRGSRH